MKSQLPLCSVIGCNKEVSTPCITRAAIAGNQFPSASFFVCGSHGHLTIKDLLMKLKREATDRPGLCDICEASPATRAYFYGGDRLADMCDGCEETLTVSALLARAQERR